jgi:hypothetical protein
MDLVGVTPNLEAVCLDPTVLAWQISSAFVKSPAAALAKAKRFVHTSHRGFMSRPACICGAAGQGDTSRGCCCNAQRA